jgi:hypothetical protein
MLMIGVQRSSEPSVSQALDVTPRIGHLHVAVDGAPWVCVGEPETPRLNLEFVYIVVTPR